MSHKKILLVPFIILLYFFVHYSTDFWYFLQPLNIIKSILKYLIVVVLIMMVGLKSLDNRIRFLACFSTLLFLFLFYGSFIDTGIALKWIEPVTHIDVGMMLIFFAVCALVVFICYRIKESRLLLLLKFWMIYCSALMVYDTALFIVSAHPEKKYLADTTAERKFQPAKKTSVFFLLFDMYPSDTVLQRYLQFDNSANANFLKRQGFYVTGNSRSLYDETYNSLASTLNVQSLGFYNDPAIKDYKKPLLALKKVETALLPSLFKRAGYTFRNFAVFDIGDQPSPLQFNLTYHLKNSFTGATFFNRCYNDFETDFFLANRGINLNFFKRSWSNQIKADTRFLGTSFENLIQGFPEAKPSLNYFHFMIPHPPILYDGSGNELPIKSRYAFNGFDSTNKRYVEYLKYGNKLIQHMINRIFEKAGKDVVIILQGDHGYREFSSQFPNAVRYGVMNAIYLPGKNYGGLYDSITVLSTFRQVLKNEFEYGGINEK